MRELENVLERAYTLCENDTIRREDLQLRHHSIGVTPASPVAREPSAEHQSASAAGDFSLPTGASLEDYLESIERDLITQALDATRWNKTAAAKELGITFRALRYKLKKLDLE